MRWNGNPSKLGILFKMQPQKITIQDLFNDVIKKATKKAMGFSGREITKLIASTQVIDYGCPNCVLDPQLLNEIVDYKVAEHR